MKRPLTADDVRSAWENFRDPWDFDAMPVLRLPIRQSMPTAIPSNLEATEPFAFRYATIKLERGYLKGRKARRLVGTVEGTDISVVLDTWFEP